MAAVDLVLLTATVLVVPPDPVFRSLLCVVVLSTTVALNHRPDRHLGHRERNCERNLASRARHWSEVVPDTDFQRRGVAAAGESGGSTRDYIRRTAIIHDA